MINLLRAFESRPVRPRWRSIRRERDAVHPAHGPHRTRARWGGRRAEAAAKDGCSRLYWFARKPVRAGKKTGEAVARTRGTRARPPGKESDRKSQRQTIKHKCASSM